MAAVPLLVPLILYQFADATQLTYANALRGTARVKPLLWVSVVSYIVIGVPVILWLAKGMGMQNVGVYYSFNVALIAAALLLWISYRRAVKWLENHQKSDETASKQ